MLNRIHENQMEYICKKVIEMYFNYIEGRFFSLSNFYHQKRKYYKLQFKQMFI